MASFMMQTIRETTQAMTNDGLPSFGADIDPVKLRAAGSRSEQSNLKFLFGGNNNGTEQKIQDG